jgi:hypothetical protein
MRQAFNRQLVRITNVLVVVAAALAAQTTAAAQDAQPSAGRLRLDGLERLAPKASEAVNIEIDGFLIKFAGAILSDKDPEERAVKEVIGGLKGLYVRSYEFNSEGQFTEADVASVREQLRAPGWSRLVDVDSRGRGFGDAEVYVASAGGRVEGFALLVVGPKLVTVINIVGAVDVDKLQRLKGTLNLPRIHIKRKVGDK